MKWWRHPLSLAGWVAAGTFAVYLATVCPTVPFGDGGELIAAADSLGVAHPPGYPLYTTLGWGALHVLPGEPALRMNLLSALSDERPVHLFALTPTQEYWGDVRKNQPSSNVQSLLRQTPG